MATAKHSPKPEAKPEKAKAEATPVNEAVAVVPEGSVFLDALDMLDMKHILGALKRYTKHAYVAGNDYECKQLTKLTEALELRLKAS